MLKEIQRSTIYDYENNKYINSTKGEYGFICPHCGNVMYKKVDYTIAFNWLHDYAAPVEESFLEICETCGKEIDTYSLDPNIAQIICDLNRMGYKTTNSCEGHTFHYEDIGSPSGNEEELPIIERQKEGYETDSAYILFENDQIMKDYPTPPEGWHWDYLTGDSKEAYLVYNPYTDHMTDFITDESWKEEALKALFIWVHSIWCNKEDEKLSK